MELLSVLNLLNVIIAVGINIILAFVVYKNNPRSHTNVLLSLLCWVTSVWLVVMYVSLLPSVFPINLLWIRLSIFLAVPQGMLFFLLAHTLPGEKMRLNRGQFLIIVAIVTCVMGLTLSPYAFTDITVVNNLPQPVSGPAIGLFALTMVLLSGSAIYILMTKYRRAVGLAREQYKFVLFGTLIMLGLIISTVLIPVILFQLNSFIAFVPLYTLFFLGSTTYAIVKHRLMDIRLVVARTVSYTLLIGVFAVFYALLFASLSSLFITAAIESRTIVVSTILAVIMAFTFQPLRRILEKITDSIFYKDHYDTNELLYELALIMASTLRLEDVTHGILKEILNKMRVLQGAFILTEKEQAFDIKSEGYRKAPAFSEEEIKLLSRSHSVILFDELEEGDLKTVLRNQELSVVVSLNTEGEQVGLLILGGKQSGDIYSEQDLNLVEILASEAAVAIQNSKAYEEIRRFNITLQEEVDKATKDLQDANLKLQELDKLKDEFVSLASHELRTPMTAIKGSLSTILEGYAGDISKEARDFMTSAYNENDRLIRLVNNLLNISRIEAGRFTFTVTKVDMNKIITEIVHNLEIAAKEKNLFFKFVPQLQLPLVYADADKVREVIINLIGNALKFTHKGGVTVAASTKDDKVVTSVADTGSGIAKEDQELLFKKFSQVQGNYTRQAGGTGLGLYISKQIVEGLKGKIWIESTLGKGSTFYFTLPITH